MRYRILQPATRATWRYGVAVLVVAASLAIRSVLDPWLGARVPYLQFFPAILISSWYGGAGPGVLATVASAVLSSVFILRGDELWANQAAALLSLGTFLATGFALAWLNGRLRAAAADFQIVAALSAARAERLDAIINTTVDGILVINTRGIVEQFNKGAERLFGYAASEVIGRNVSMLMPSPDAEQHDGYIERYLRTGEARIIGVGRQVTAKKRDGTLFPAHLSVSEMSIHGERKFTGMLHDLTERARLEAGLRASEALWRSIIESAVDGIVVIDARGQIEAFNPSAERMFGYTEAEVLGQNVKLLMPAPYHEEHDSYMARYLATGEPRIIGKGREVTARRKDGSMFPVHLSVGELGEGADRKFTGILHDLTERVRMEERLREQATLARLGEMAAVLAHEVKNPLAGIRGAIQVIGSRLPPESRERTIAHEVVSRIDGLSALMKDLLLFARPPQPNPTPVDVIAIVTTTVNLLAEDPQMGGVRIDVAGASPPVLADAELLKIVFVNLLVNGAQAMQGQGVIHVSVTAKDRMCEIAVQDAGPGIPLEIRDQLFTPFFTTKARGTGLGLPTAKGLVEAHGGTIAVDCPSTGGTQVIVRLPLS